MTAADWTLLVQSAAGLAGGGPGGLETPFWPVTATGWVTLVGFFAMLGGGLWAAAKFVAELNGLGKRVEAVETARTKLETLTNGIDRRQELVERELRQLTQLVGEARAAADGLRTATTQHRDEIMRAINDAQRTLAHEFGQWRERVIRIEADVQHLPKRHGDTAR